MDTDNRALVNLVWDVTGKVHSMERLQRPCFSAVFLDLRGKRKSSRKEDSDTQRLEGEVTMLVRQHEGNMGLCTKFLPKTSCT